jgi:hypothetical protein
MGIKDESDIKLANNIWKLLDEMSENDPLSYEKFIEKNLTEGFMDAKVEQDKKEEPYRIVPIEYAVV